MENLERAYQIIVDCCECDEEIIDSEEKIREIVHTVCNEIKTNIVEECYHKFEPIGISAMAIITTSHFSIHTWPEKRYAAVDIFSCSENISEKIGYYIGKLLRAERTRVRKIERNIG